MDTLRNEGALAPRVSIGVPVYNGAGYLGETLEAISSQRFENFEVIISDNASTDGTEDVARAHCAHDPRFRYVRRPENAGVKHNFNGIVPLAGGAYFKWWAADDLGSEEYLQACVDALDAKPEAVLAFSPGRFFDPTGVQAEWEPRAETMADVTGPRVTRVRRMVRLLSERPEITPIYLAGLFRREAMLRTPLLGAYPASDLAFIARMALYGTFARTPGTELRVRHREGSAGRDDTHGDYAAMHRANDPLAPAPRVVWLWARRRFAEYASFAALPGLSPLERAGLLRAAAEAVTYRGERWAARKLRRAGRPHLAPHGV